MKSDISDSLTTKVTSNHSGSSQSLWMDVPVPLFTSLKSNINADVCIVGAGISGLTVAYTLAKQGKSVIVVDQGVVGGGQTARTTAHLTWALDDRYYRLEEIFGEEWTQKIAESHSTAIDYIEQIVNQEEIACDFERVNGYLFLAPEDSPDLLQKEFAAVKKIGKTVIKNPQLPLGVFFDSGSCLCFPQQAQFHILKYLNGLLKAILRYGGQIFSHTLINHFEDGSPCLLTTNSGIEIRTQSVVVTTGTPVNNRFMIHTKQAPYRTYVIAAQIAKGSVPKALYWDTCDPYHYIRTHPVGSDSHLEWLIVGGEDHKTGQDSNVEEKYDSLSQWARSRFPMIEKIDYKWSGQVLEPVDALAFIGRNPEGKNIYIATGNSGNGMTYGTIAGILIPDLIAGKDHPWEKLYKPSRKTLLTAPEFLHENFNVACQYADWLTPGEATELELLPPEEGVILRKGMKKIAVYKDKHNEIHVNSAFCPHLGGCVRWNPGEKSWDCPCHGSRFDAYGNVMNGPTKSRLPRYKKEKFIE